MEARASLVRTLYKFPVGCKAVAVGEGRMGGGWGLQDIHKGGGASQVGRTL